MRVNYVGVRCTGCGIWYAALKAVAAEVTDADTTASFVYQRKVRGLKGVQPCTHTCTVFQARAPNQPFLLKDNFSQHMMIKRGLFGCKKFKTTLSHFM
jgi:hypothetical protein